jgi:hypothetical protein
MVGGSYIDSLSYPELSSHKEQRNYSIRGMGEEKVKTLLLMDLGLFGQSQCANSQEAQAWTKDC